MDTRIAVPTVLALSLLGGAAQAQGFGGQRAFRVNGSFVVPDASGNLVPAATATLNPDPFNNGVISRLPNAVHDPLPFTPQQAVNSQASLQALQAQQAQQLRRLNMQVQMAQFRNRFQGQINPLIANMFPGGATSQFQSAALPGTTTNLMLQQQLTAQAAFTNQAQAARFFNPAGSAPGLSTNNFASGPFDAAGNPLNVTVATNGVVQGATNNLATALANTSNNNAFNNSFANNSFITGAANNGLNTLTGVTFNGLNGGFANNGAVNAFTNNGLNTLSGVQFNGVNGFNNAFANNGLNTLSGVTFNGVNPVVNPGFTNGFVNNGFVNPAFNNGFVNPGFVNRFNNGFVNNSFTTATAPAASFVRPSFSPTRAFAGSQTTVTGGNVAGFGSFRAR